LKTLVDIDELLLQKAMTLTGAKTKKETINAALQELVRLRLRQELISVRGSDILDMTLEELTKSRQKRTQKHVGGKKS